MDNFEHIIEGAEVVREILSAGPAVKILATSREALDIEGERTFEVKGLRYPLGGDAAQMEASSAVQLFLKSARRVHPNFTLASEDRGPLLDICRFLEGMPLGLELSATWVGTLSLADIAGKIETSRDFLATSMPYLPARHRSLRAVFEYSWILLTEAQKKALKAISVFRGGFTLEAVKKVAGADEDLLKRLAQKSLLRKRDGRYEIHELLKYYAKEKLFDDPVEKEKSLDTHCRYYSQWLQKKEKDLSGPRQKKVMEEMVQEIDNLREAWRRGVEKRMAGELEDCLEGYFSILETKGWLEEGRGAFRKAAQGLREAYPGKQALPGRVSLLLARLLCRCADFERSLGDAAKAGELLKESLERLEGSPASSEMGKVLGGLGQVMENEGNNNAAKSYYLGSFRAFHRAKDRHGAAWSLNQLGHIESVAGNFKAAQKLIRQSLSHSEAMGDQRSMGHSYNLMGDMLHELAKREESKAYYQKGLSAYLESGDRRGMSWSFINLGRAAEGLGDFTGARQMIQEGLAIVRDLRDLRGEAWCDNLLGSIDWATGDYKEAYHYYGEALALYRKVGDKRGEAWTLDMTGNLKLAQREDKEAETFFRQAYDLVTLEGLNRRNKAWHAYHLGALEMVRERPKEAQAFFHESLALFRPIEDGLGQVACLIQLGEAALELQEPGRALGHFREAAALALRFNLIPFLPDLLLGIAKWMKVEGDERQAVSFLMVALAHPTCRRQTKDRAISFSLALQSHFPAEQVEGARQWAKTTRIEDVVSAWLSAHGKGLRKKGPVRKKPSKVKISRKIKTGKKRMKKKK
jgi:predicted ATPase